MKNELKQKKIQVSIGIPAFNEANNIKNVLIDILGQHQENWELKEILVYNDGSTDATVQKIKELKDNRIILIDSNERKGKTFRLSQMFKQFLGEILVMFDGDIRLLGNTVITDMLVPFKATNVMLVGGNSIPFFPKNFFQRSVYATFSVFYKSRLKMKGGNNIFGCTGSIWAIRKKLAIILPLPNIINEDAFIYLYCINKGFRFIYQDGAVAFYKLPNNLLDYLRQTFRSHPTAVTLELDRYFGALARNEFKRPFVFYFSSVLSSFWENPMGTVYIVLIHIACKPLFRFISTRYKLSWFTAKSTH